MNMRRMRVGLALAVVATAMMASPRPSYAIFHWFRNCFRRPAAVPVVAASPCTTQTVQYVPQTSYRTQIVHVPVTTYQPVRACGVCGPVTALRPVTTLRPTTQVVPYTTYRPVVVSTPTVSLRPTVTLMPTTTTTLYAPTVISAPAASCCGAAAPATTYAPPATSAPSVPSYTSPSPSYGTPSYTTPAPSNGSSYTSPSPSGSGEQTPQPRLRPVTPNNGQQQGTQNGNGGGATQSGGTSSGSPAQGNGSAEGSGNRQSSLTPAPIPYSEPGPAGSQNAPSSPAAGGDDNQSGPYFAPPASRTTWQDGGWTQNNYSPVNWTAARPNYTPAAGQPAATVQNRPAIDDGGWQPVRP